jgi:hypothetical protein
MEIRYSLIQLMSSTARFYLVRSLSPDSNKRCLRRYPSDTSIKLIMQHNHLVRPLLAPNCEHKLSSFFRERVVTAVSRFSATIARFVYPL